MYCVHKPSTLIPTGALLPLGLIIATSLRAPNEKSFHGGVIAILIDIAGHAAVAVKIGKMAPMIDLRIDYLRPSVGQNLIARARLLKLGGMLARVDIDVADTQRRSIAVCRGSFSTALG
jgi:uncharacterized protein (TIGR00369 family)